MTFTQSVSTCFNKYATFTGRASRSEYWWFYVLTAVVTIVASALDATFDTSWSELNSGLIQCLATLALLLPSLSVGVRRCHDTNHSGWWLLCPIYNIILMCVPSDEGENEYGTLEEVAATEEDA